MLVHDRYFIALLPPQAMQDYANRLRQYFADRYASKKAFNSPPHITLQSPFEWSEVAVLSTIMANFAQTQSAIPVTLVGFGAFPPKVIFIDVLRSVELLTLQRALQKHCETALGIHNPYADRPFAPHMTVAFRDLTKANFQRAWPEFEDQSLALSNDDNGNYQFVADRLTLLKHHGQRWEVEREFPLRPPNADSPQT